MKEEKSSNRHRFRNDLILIAVLLTAVAVGVIYLYFFRTRGDVVEVTVDGKPYGTYLLSEDTTEDICTGENREQHNRLVISGGKASIETATCPDGICASHSPIFRDGESIVCLPHRVVVTVISKKSDAAPDTVG